jgi:chromosome partitioning protein
MSEIIVFANQKGGVAKTSTTTIFGQRMFYMGKKVLFIDLDPQGNMSHTLRASPKKATVMNVLLGEISISAAVQKIHYGDCLCSTPLLSSAELKIKTACPQFLLRDTLDTIKERYDYIVIDTPPALGILTVNALTAGDQLVIPAQPDIYSLQGMTDFADTIGTVKKHCNRVLHIAGILITRFNRTIISGDFAEQFELAARKLKTKVFKSRIRECVAIKEAEAARSDIFVEARNSNAVSDYEAFIKEYLEDRNVEQETE